MRYEFVHYIAGVETTPTIVVTAASLQEAESKAVQKVRDKGLSDNGLAMSNLAFFRSTPNYEHFL